MSVDAISSIAASGAVIIASGLVSWAAIEAQRFFRRFRDDGNDGNDGNDGGGDVPKDPTSPYTIDPDFDPGDWRKREKEKDKTH